jgi:hypothetical protein
VAVAAQASESGLSARRKGLHLFEIHLEFIWGGALLWAVLNEFYRAKLGLLCSRLVSAFGGVLVVGGISLWRRSCLSGA